MSAASLILATMLLAVPDRPAEAKPKDTWVGKVVFVRASGGELDPAAEPGGLRPNGAEGVPLTSNQYRVYAERGEHVRIKTRDGVSGWVSKADLVPLEDAVALFSKQIDANPKDYAALNRRASAWRFRGNFDAALKDMDEAMRISNSSSTYNNRGLVWHARRDFEQAIADFSKAIEMNGHELNLVNRASSYLANKENDRAIADANAALEMQPRYPEAFRVRGLAWLEKKEYDKAIDSFTRAIDIDAKHADALAERARAWAAKSEHARARDDFNQALRLEPWNLTITANAALWLASCPDAKYRDGKRALELALAAQKREPSNSLVLQARAAAHAELGQLKEAVLWQEHALNDRLLANDAAARERLLRYRKLHAAGQK